MVVKTKEEAKANLEASVSYIPARYESGIQKADWATPAGSEQAEKNYAAGVGKAVSKKSRQKGVKAVSNENWKDAAIEKGKGIIGDRITQALPKWEKNWGPMYDQVVGVVKGLPPKTTDFRTNITNRSIKTVEAWKKAAGKL